VDRTISNIGAFYSCFVLFCFDKFQSVFEELTSSKVISEVLHRNTTKLCKTFYFTKIQGTKIPLVGSPWWVGFGSRASENFWNLHFLVYTIP